VSRVGREKLGWVRDAAGDRFDGLELNAYPSGGPVVVTDDARPEARSRADDLRRLTGMEIAADEVLESPHVVIGSIDEDRRAAGAPRDQLDHARRHGRAGPVVERLAGRQAGRSRRSTIAP